MKFLIPLVAASILIMGCSKYDSHQAKSESKPISQESPPIESKAVPLHNEEPSEEVLRKLEFQVYAEIERMGGLPVTITATGKSLILHPKLYEVRKERCTPTPQAPAGWYECSLTIKLSLSEDGSNPSEQGERIAVKRNKQGAWELQ